MSILHGLRQVHGFRRALLAAAIVGVVSSGESPRAWGAPAFDPQHAALTAVLKKSVTTDFPSAYVDYAALKAQPAALAAYLQSLESVTPAQFNGWKKNDRLAFLINAFNGGTLKALAERYPVKSLAEVPAASRTLMLLGKKISLDELEQLIFRKEWKDVRARFALSYGARGGPALSEDAYTGAALSTQLDAAVKRFLSDARKNYFTGREKRLYLSHLFEKYADDFKKPKGVRAFVAPFLAKTSDEAKSIQDEETEVIYLPWDGTLNEKGAGGEEG